jgi:hypothetical protein
MSEVTQPDSTGSMKLHDTRSFETAQGVVDVLRVAPGWVDTWRGTHNRRDGAVEPRDGSSTGNKRLTR